MVYYFNSGQKRTSVSLFVCDRLAKKSLYFGSQAEGIK